MKRSSSDPQLDAHGTDMLNAIRMSVATHCQIRIDRKLNVKKVVHSLLGKELIKEKRDICGELLEPSDFLLEYNLGEKNRELIKSVRASENCNVIGYAFQREALYHVRSFHGYDALQIQRSWPFLSIQRC